MKAFTTGGIIMKIGFIGLGIMGKPMVLNLLKNGYEVKAFDLNEQNLKLLKEKNANIRITVQNLKELSTYNSFLSPFDLVVTAVPGFMGFDTLKTVIECGKNVVDISFNCKRN